MNIGFAQINSTVGDFVGNRELILQTYSDLVAQGADLVITPELALIGYPPQDLLFVGDFVKKNYEELHRLQEQVGAVPLIVGCVDRHEAAQGKSLFNAAAVLRQGSPIEMAHKRLLPNYDVFDESRYFEPGKSPCIVEIQGQKIGITICEDLWSADFLPEPLYSCDPLQELIEAGARLIVNLSASPFHLGKNLQREKMLRAQAKRSALPIAYCNAVGGNDHLIFDGHSMLIAAGGEAVERLSGCSQEKRVIAIESVVATPIEVLDERSRRNMELNELYHALVLGVRDYLYKCGFKKALLGLSGGIDSALVAAVAVAALGAESVTGVLMPGPYSSQGSIDDALALSRNLGMPVLQLPITDAYNCMLQTLREPFEGYPADVTEENLQSRLRGLTLMALSNRWGAMVLTTGNKSEMAVGYCTLYGDMCGGLAVIADVSKGIVYELAHWINRERELIPHATLEKEPSAELRPNQKDRDSLPPYDVLDAILQLVVEEHRSIEEIVKLGFEERMVRWVVTQLYRSEYKRQQAAPGLKVTSRAFGIGRRFPIAQHYGEW